MSGVARRFELEDEPDPDVAQKPKKRKLEQGVTLLEGHESINEDAVSSSAVHEAEHRPSGPAASSSNNTSTTLTMPPSDCNKKSVILSEGPPAVNAAVHISNQGVEYHISGSASVYFQYGSHINAHSGKNALSAVIRNLIRSHNAEYDMVANTTRGPCTPETRTAILQKLVDWCNSSNVPLYWLNGMAGTGKTTIAYSVCKMLADVNLLGASFFCSRSLTDCRDIKFIIPTIAFQLAQRYLPFAEALAEALEQDPDVLSRGYDAQLRTLLINPWKARQGELPSYIVIVLDALDECDCSHSKFLKILFDHVWMLPFKIMITSRPEHAIRSILLNKDSETLSTFILHEVEESLVEEDISRYVESQLKKCLPLLVQSDALRLSKQCGKFFVYAATLCRFILDEDGDHDARFESLLSLSPSDVRDMAVQPIDALYIEILRQAFSDKKPQSEIDGIKTVLHIIVFARDPLTREAIAALLEWKVATVEARLKSLRSLIFVPQAIDQSLSTFHASLLDFLQNSARSAKFYHPPEGMNMEMAKRCLALMNRELRMNPCQMVERPPNALIHPDLIRKHITAGLRYATVYWTGHWELSGYSRSQGVIDPIYEFLTKHVFHWLECLSLIGMLPASTPSLEVLHDGLYEYTDLARLIYDFLRFIQYFYDLIKHNAMEICFSALTWIPPHSPLRVRYGSIHNNAPRVLCGSAKCWPEPTRIINTHSLSVGHVAVSQDGNLIISAFNDGTMHIWNVYEHAQECTLKFGDFREERGLSSLLPTWAPLPVRHISISAHGSRVVSGIESGVEVWNTTRRVVFPLGTSTFTRTVAISPDDKWIASGLIGYRVHIWNAITGHFVHSLQGHTKSVTSVSFTSDNSRLVSTSYDDAVYVWNVMTGKMESTLRGHTGSVWSMACSPVRNQIITGSEDKTARLWNALGKELQVLRGHSNRVCCVDFMPDGKRVVTGSDDQTLRVWDLISGNTVHEFAGLGNAVRSVAVFPDGHKIASSSDKSLSIWNLRGETSVGREGAEGDGLPLIEEAKAMIFSSNGQKVFLLRSLCIMDTTTLEKILLQSKYRDYRCGALSVSGNKAATMSDRLIEVWELTADGVVGNQFTLKVDRHPNSLLHLPSLGGSCYTPLTYHLSFSHNELILASAPADKTARIWDLPTGKQTHIFDHRDSGVIGVAFSHNDTQIVSTTRSRTHIWDPQSGEHLRHYCSSVHSSVFTPDDQHLITSHIGIIELWDATTRRLEHTYDGYIHWTTLNDGSSYALSDDGQWVCRSSRLDEQPRKLLWIPSQYRPTLPTPSRLVRDDEPPEYFASGPLFTTSPRGVQVCLPRRDGLVTLIIPHDN